MTDTIRLQVGGLRELGEQLRKINDQTAKRIAVQATGAAARVVRDAAKDKAAVSDKAHYVRLQASDRGSNSGAVLVQPGNLKKNIVAKKTPKKYLGDLTSAHLVTVRGKKKDGYAARYGRLVEFGKVGMSPLPFLRPAFDQNIQKALDVMKETLSKGIARAAKS